LPISILSPPFDPTTNQNLLNFVNPVNLANLANLC